MRMLPTLLALVLLTGSLQAADNLPASFILAKIDGIEGELTNKEFNWENMIRIQTLNGEWTRNTAGQLLSKIKMEKRPQSVKFTKAVDKATPLLVRRASDGVSIINAQFQFYGTITDDKGATIIRANYFTITLKNVTVTKTQIHTDATGNATEEVTLDYEHCDMRSVTGKTEYISEK